MFQHIPELSITGMVFTAAIGLFLPTALAILGLTKLKGKFIPVILGAVTFLVFALILESIMHNIVLGSTGDIITGNIWLYALYGGLAAAVFEECGRFIVMKTLMKKWMTKENAIMFGIGHGGFEAIVVAGLTGVSNAATAIMINNGQLEDIVSVLGESDKAQFLEKISALWTTQPLLFFLGGLERIPAVFLHICLTYMVYRAVKEAKPLYFFMALGTHFLVDALVVIISNLLNVYVFEAFFVVAVAVIGYFTYRWYKADDGKNLISYRKV